MKNKMGLFRKRKAEGSGHGTGGIPRTLAPPDGYGTGVLSYHIGNLQGVGARDRQEDSFCVVNALDADKIDRNGLFFAVCDGMGGMKDGKLASETAAAALRDAFTRLDGKEDIALALRRAVAQASEKVEARLAGDGGSTLAGGVIYRDRLYYVSVGDSALYLRRGKNLYRLNHEQNLCHEIYLDCIRKGIVDPAQGRGDPESAALTGFLGMRGLYAIDASVRPLPIQGSDVLLACSDGVSGVLSEEEICASLDGDDPARMCRELEDRIVEHRNPYQDNYTAVVVKCFG